MVYELPRELLKDLRQGNLRKLGNFRKISNLGGDIAYCPVYQKSNFSDNCQNVSKNRYQRFLFLFSFTEFLTLFQIFCPEL